MTVTNLKRSITSVLNSEFDSILEDLKATGEKPNEEINKTLADAVLANFGQEEITAAFLADYVPKFSKAQIKKHNLLAFLANHEQSDFFGPEVCNSLISIGGKDGRTLPAGEANLDVFEVVERNVIDNKVRQDAKFVTVMGWMKEAKDMLGGDRSKTLKEVIGGNKTAVA